MSRFSFILGITMLVVAGTAVFMISFDRDAPVSEATGHGANGVVSSEKRTWSRQESRRSQSRREENSDSSLTLAPNVTAHLDQDRLARVNDILVRTENEARQKLAELSRQYRLTDSQKRRILPLILAHHDQAHPAMSVNGQFLPAIPPGAKFEDSLASVLDPDQQDALIEESLDDEAWWKEIVGQLENDLDAAIESGEIVPTDESSTPNGPALSDSPASGDGEASEHSGGNLFDLLGR